MPACIAFNCTSRTPAFSRSPEHDFGSKSLKKCELSRNKVKISFFPFPKNPALLKRWIVNCRRQDWKPTKWSRICSKHFKDSDIIKHKVKCTLVDGAVPSIFDFPMHLKKVESHRRILKRRTYEEDSTIKRNSDDMIEKRSIVNIVIDHTYALPSTMESLGEVTKRVNIVIDHTYALPSTMETLGEVTKRAKRYIMILSEKNELLSTHLKALKIKNKIICQSKRRLQKRITNAKDLCRHLTK
uniref:THAP domaincontaining protein 6like [Xiphosphorus maculatus] n=1 Tax=Lepeophtheirus salmonis TaxID=72036 RepID=A0A0K2UVC2_LEPSM